MSLFLLLSFFAGLGGPGGRGAKPTEEFFDRKLREIREARTEEALRMARRDLERVPKTPEMERTIKEAEAERERRKTEGILNVERKLKEEEANWKPKDVKALEAARAHFAKSVEEALPQGREVRLSPEGNLVFVDAKPAEKPPMELVYVRYQPRVAEAPVAENPAEAPLEVVKSAFKPTANDTSLDGAHTVGGRAERAIKAVMSPEKALSENGRRESATALAVLALSNRAPVSVKGLEPTLSEGEFAQFLAQAVDAPGAANLRTFHGAAYAVFQKDSVRVLALSMLQGTAEGSMAQKLVRRYGQGNGAKLSLGDLTTAEGLRGFRESLDKSIEAVEAKLRTAEGEANRERMLSQLITLKGLKSVFGEKIVVDGKEKEGFKPEEIQKLQKLLSKDAELNRELDAYLKLVDNVEGAKDTADRLTRMMKAQEQLRKVMDRLARTEMDEATRAKLIDALNAAFEAGADLVLSRAADVMLARNPEEFAKEVDEEATTRREKLSREGRLERQREKARQKLCDLKCPILAGAKACKFGGKGRGRGAMGSHMAPINFGGR